MDNLLGQGNKNLGVENWDGGSSKQTICICFYNLKISDLYGKS